MKRSIKFVVAIIVSVVTVICILFGCQKEKDKTTVELNQDKALAVMKRINDFKEIREAVNSGIKSNGVMTVEEMRQAIDATFNYEHSQHNT